MSATETFSIAARVRRARREAALTQVELAELMGCTPRAVQWWEYDKRTPSARLLRRLSEVTGKPIGWFFEEPA